MMGIDQYGRRILAMGMICLLAACSGGDGSQDTSGQPAAQPPAQEEAAPPADTAFDDSPNPQVQRVLQEITGNSLYYRAPEYPKIARLPLQFITSVNGRKLSVRVTLPANADGTPAEGPFPAILTQAAYNTNLLNMLFLGIPGNLMMGADDSFVVRRGYAQVAVDAMGTGASEGGWELLGEDEQQGFADAVDWVHSQPWFNGKLGLAGVSYMAISSLFAAQRRPDSVDAIFASLPMGDAMRDTVGIGGMINANFMSEWMFITHALSTQHVPTMLANPQHMSYLMRVTEEHVAQIENYHLPLIDDALWGASYVTYDSDFWRLRSPIENIHKIEAPTFFLGALDDLFQRGVPLMFEALQKKGLDTKMVVFNGTHIENFLMPHIGNTAVPPIDYLMLQWFDKHLKDLDTGIEQMPPVTQYVKNYPTASTPQELRGDSYVTASTWPHPQATPERWYLRGDGSLTRTPPAGDESGLQMTQPPHPEGYAYQADALIYFNVSINDGSKCSRSYLQWVLGLALPQTCFYNTNNSQQQRLVFETEPMEEDYFINGPLQADIWISSNVTEAVVAVQVEAVFKNRSQPITDGQLLASGRALDESRSRVLKGEMIQPYHWFREETSQPLVPGEVVKLPIEIFPTSVIIPKGAKLRISISPSNQAQAMLNYPRQALTEGGITTLHISPEHPSSVVMPIVPLSALN